jgi:hypothetical protein
MPQAPPRVSFSLEGGGSEEDEPEEGKGKPAPSPRRKASGSPSRLPLPSPQGPAGGGIKRPVTSPGQSRGSLLVNEATATGSVDKRQRL